jgi:hypothetical protein
MRDDVGGAGIARVDAAGAGDDLRVAQSLVVQHHILLRGGASFPLQIGHICSAFDGELVSVPLVSWLPAKQSVGSSICWGGCPTLVTAKSPFVGFP